VEYRSVEKCQQADRYDRLAQFILSQFAPTNDDHAAFENGTFAFSRTL
jgi:hypothetical protein